MGNHGKGCCKHCARVGLCFLLCTSWCLTLLLLLFDVYFLSSPLERCKPRDSRACPLSPCPSLVPVHSLKPGLVGDRMTGWLAAAQKSTADSAAGGVALPVGCGPQTGQWPWTPLLETPEASLPSITLLLPPLPGIPVAPPLPEELLSSLRRPSLRSHLPGFTQQTSAVRALCFSFVLNGRSLRRRPSLGSEAS